VVVVVAASLEQISVEDAIRLVAYSVVARTGAHQIVTPLGRDVVVPVEPDDHVGARRPDQLVVTSIPTIVAGMPKQVGTSSATAGHTDVGCSVRVSSAETTTDARREAAASLRWYHHRPPITGVAQEPLRTIVQTARVVARCYIRAQ
jgi:hypothetical protein